MPQASPQAAAQVKYWLKNHALAKVEMSPPVQNTWYTILDEEDVRLLYVFVDQTNTEEEAKDLEFRWTIDGEIYVGVKNLDHANCLWCYRMKVCNPVVTDYIDSSGAPKLSDNDTYLCALDIKIEVRMTSAAGTAQTLNGYAQYETLEAT